MMLNKKLNGNHHNLKAWLLAFLKPIKNNNVLITCLLFLFGFVCIFVSGVFSSETKKELCANYFSDIALNHTDNLHNKKLSGLIVEPKDNSDKKMLSTYSELLSLYGTFREDNVAFAPVINANKEKNIYFVDETISFNNLSFLYSSDGGASIPYDGGYLFQCYPLSVMFESGHSGTVLDSFIYISETHAKNILMSRGYSESDLPFETLIGENIQLLIDDIQYDFVIDNIYLDDYYSVLDIAAIIGDFVFTYFHGADGSFADNLKKQGLYFMSEYTFRNEYYLDYVTKTYDYHYYDYKFATNNIESGFIPNEQIFNDIFYPSNNVFSILITVVGIGLLLFGIIFSLAKRLYRFPSVLLMIFLSSVTPYCLFKMINIITNNILLFSKYSTNINMFSTILICLFFIFVLLFERPISKRNQL